MSSFVSSVYLQPHFPPPLGSGLNKWDVAKVISLNLLFRRADSFNADISRWNVAVATDFGNTFIEMSYDSCNKRKIADAWKSNTAFASKWVAVFAADACPPLTDAQFKQASWGT